MAKQEAYERISNHLKENGISQTFIWKKHKVSRTQLSEYLRGNRSLEKSKVDAILKTLKIK